MISKWSKRWSQSGQSDQSGEFHDFVVSKVVFLLQKWFKSDKTLTKRCKKWYQKATNNWCKSCRWFSALKILGLYDHVLISRARKKRTLLETCSQKWSKSYTRVGVGTLCHYIYGLKTWNPRVWTPKIMVPEQLYRLHNKNTRAKRCNKMDDNRCTSIWGNNT